MDGGLVAELRLPSSRERGTLDGSLGRPASGGETERSAIGRAPPSKASAGRSGIGASRPVARVPAKVPSLNTPAVTQTWWCEPLLMPRRGRWCRSPPSRRRSAIRTAASRLVARPICCRACATISVSTLIVASTRRTRSTRAGARTARKSRSACGRSFRRGGPIYERSSILSRSIDATV
jgi:hypothetical protein